MFFFLLIENHVEMVRGNPSVISALDSPKTGGAANSLICQEAWWGKSHVTLTISFMYLAL